MGRVRGMVVRFLADETVRNRAKEARRVPHGILRAFSQPHVAHPSIDTDATGFARNGYFYSSAPDHKRLSRFLESFPSQSRPTSRSTWGNLRCSGLFRSSALRSLAIEGTDSYTHNGASRSFSQLATLEKDLEPADVCGDGGTLVTSGKKVAVIPTRRRCRTRDIFEGHLKLSEDLRVTKKELKNAEVRLEQDIQEKSLKPKRGKGNRVRKKVSKSLETSACALVPSADNVDLCNEDDTKVGNSCEDASVEASQVDEEFSQSLNKDSSKNGIIGKDTSLEASQQDEKHILRPLVPKTSLDFSDLDQIFNALLVSKQAGNMSPSARQQLTKILDHFCMMDSTRNQALGLYIKPSLFPTISRRFKKFFLHRVTPIMREHLLKLGKSRAAYEFLFPIFAKFSIHEYSAEISIHQALLTTADLTKPHTWYPFARAIRRKLVYHCGPTNSGKTFMALERLKGALSGIYCCPLRLLAMEAYEKLNAEGVYCSLLTGQERREVPFANHLACTIEVASTQRAWEVAVIDEVQMISDEFRGWAWTRAILGVQADEVHLCGDPSALALVKNICGVTGDDLQVLTYERFKPLTIDNESLQGDVRHVQSGDCIVAFSRKDIFLLKKAIEQKTQHRCCVVYGSLPPETRTEQARLFNDPGSGFDVLVASDAVGMGLNLNIRRLIFFSMEKFNGVDIVQVSPSQVKQIAGRAGRRGSLFPEGKSTTFFAKDVEYLASCLEAPFDISKSAGLFPSYEQLEVFASQFTDVTFSELLDRFSETCIVDGSYFLCRNDNIKHVASLLDKITDLSLEERFVFCFAPINVRDSKAMQTLLQFAVAYSKKMAIPLSIGVPSSSAKNVLQLLDLETRHQILSMYLWLSQHLCEEFFPQVQEAEEMASDIALLLGESLAKTISSYGIQRLTRSKHRKNQSRILVRHQPVRGRAKKASQITSI